ncbi:uncharacterized protein EI90DRAFT_370312 [Cantharellus anzutake]|uniref:uncharacterized protein n=1 Tax=Cantharellus anzutake TaxID=1750568 RepID=UPI001906A848|nr:uncharacterized protein EI90DRAFT_370312 [Cantharellus anzutake]KAF8334865.1 hypothetical protein EI90DRAFT_370312 [Cantharellus anzutake]
MSQRASLGSRRRAASGGSILSSWWSKVRKRTRSRASSTRSAPNASPSAHSIPRALGATSPISFHSHSSDSSQVPAPRLALLFDGAYNPPPRFDPSVILFGPVPSILPALKRLHNFPTSSSCEVGNLHPSGNTASPARVPPNLRFISLSKPLFSPYPETQLDLSHAQVERFTVREALGSGRGYALLQLAEPGGSMYTLRLEHGKFENGDEGKQIARTNI